MEGLKCWGVSGGEVADVVLRAWYAWHVELGRSGVLHDGNTSGGPTELWSGGLCAKCDVDFLSGNAIVHRGLKSSAFATAKQCVHSFGVEGPSVIVCVFCLSVN